MIVILGGMILRRSESHMCVKEHCLWRIVLQQMAILLMAGM